MIPQLKIFCFAAAVLAVTGQLAVAPFAFAAGVAELAGLRLFMSADQRAQIDSQRNNPEKVETIVAAPEPAAIAKKPLTAKPQPVPLTEVKVQGYVLRSEGENTVWVNDRAVVEGQSADQKIQIISIDDTENSVQIKMPDESVIQLKPGQRFEPSHKKIVDPLGQ